MLKYLILLTIISLAVAEKVSYKNYKVLTINPGSKDNVNYLKSIEINKKVSLIHIFDLFYSILFY